jgi:hypothetical protein
MKEFAAELVRRRARPELIYCSSDLRSLDGVLAPELGISMLDATPPHVMEPQYPGACETLVPIENCWDEHMLKASRAEIIGEFRACHTLQMRAINYLAAAGDLMNEVLTIANACISQEKVLACAARICAAEFSRKKRPGPGKEEQRFLSAVTADGVWFWSSTVRLLCRKIYVIEDDCGAVSKLFYGGRAQACAGCRPEHHFLPLHALPGQQIRTYPDPGAGACLFDVQQTPSAGGHALPRDPCAALHQQRASGRA